MYSQDNVIASGQLFFRWVVSCIVGWVVYWIAFGFLFEPGVFLCYNGVVVYSMYIGTYANACGVKELFGLFF